MKTFSAKPGQVERRWFLIDLKDQVLGRAASQIANLLRGKTKPTYTPHIDTGDFVIAINADKIKLTGKKLTDKIYYKHSGFIGGLRRSTAEALLKRHPEELITRAVKGMLPHTALGKKILKKFKVYAGSDHPHQAQQAQSYELKY